MRHVKSVMVQSSVLKIKEKHDKGIQKFRLQIAVRKKSADQRMQQRLLARSKKNKVGSGSGGASGAPSLVGPSPGDVQVEVIRKCVRAVVSTTKRLAKLVKKLTKETATEGLCKAQFVQMIMLCVKKQNRGNEVGGTLQVKSTTIDAMWVLIQPRQVNDREEISAELLGAWLFS